ncbi:MAG TPA: hypothetical protein VNZ22_03545 [Bacillota bacterium]|nr:hypothetical protein [Bacillota bacterium]
MTTAQTSRFKHFNLQSAIYNLQSTPAQSLLRRAATIGCFLCLSALASPSAHAELIPLPIENAAWERRVFLEKNSQLSEAQAATLAIEQDPEMGPCLVIGPWRAGQWSARFDSTRLLSYTNGTVRGFYRTTDLLP